MRHAHAFLFQALRIGDALVAQRIVRDGQHEGRRRRRQIGRTDRRTAPVGALGRTVQVKVDKPAHRGRRQQHAFGDALVRTERHRQIDDGIDQQLVRQLRQAAGCSATAAARLPPALSPPTATRAGSMPSEAALSNTKRVAAAASSNAGGKPVFRRHPIIDRDDPALRGIRQMPAHAVMRFEIAEHPAAAVEIHQCRLCRARRRTGRHIKPQRNVAVRAWRFQIAHLRHRLRRSAASRARVAL